MTTQKKRKPRKKGEPRDKPIALPIDFEEALKALLITKPEPKDSKKKKGKKKSDSK
jgi:hypothetical protein